LDSNPLLKPHQSVVLVRIVSWIIACLMAAAAVAGLLFRGVFYPEAALVRAFVPNDVVNLIIGLPALLVSMELARRGRLIGLLCWPGALFFVLYNFIIYALAMRHNAGFLLYLVLVALSVYALAGLVAAIDGKVVQDRLKNAVPEKTSGGVLAGLGLLFFLRVIFVVLGAQISQTSRPETELALHISDFLITPAWIIGGILLWRREELGYVAGLGLLFQASTLFIGLIIFMVLQPALTGAPFVLADVVVILVMGLVCFIPFVRFARSVVNA